MHTYKENTMCIAFNVICLEYSFQVQNYFTSAKKIYCTIANKTVYKVIIIYHLKKVFTDFLLS